MIIAALILVLAQEETTTVTLAFEKMHCDECRAEVEAIVKKMQGCASVAVEGDAVKAAFEEKAPMPAFNRLPQDLKLKSATIAIRGTVSFSGEKAALVARGSGATLALANPEGEPKVDRLADLRKALGGKNRFRITGALSGKTIVLASFSATDWKDAK